MDGQASVGECCIVENDSSKVISPIIVDMTSAGAPDLMAGPNAWSKDRKPTTGVLDHYRVFEMIKGTPDLWEWVGPNAGILVSGKPSVVPQGRLSGQDLFGTSTWGRAWENGYQPLATLDLNKDGELSGQELSGLYVWRDLNGDAVADPGEVEAAFKRFLWIRVTPEKSGTDRWLKKGARLKTGEIVQTWDWWSQLFRRVYYSFQRPELVIPTAVQASDKGASVYYFQYLQDPKTRGFLRFFNSDGQLYVAVTNPLFGRTRDAAFAPVKVKRDNAHGGYELSWRLFGGDGVLITRAFLFDNGAIKAASFSTNSKQPVEQKWQAFPVGLPKPAYPEGSNVALPGDFMALRAIPDRDFVNAVIDAGNTPGTRFLIPVGPQKPLPYRSLLEFVQ
jgi:hypothetical protein